MDAGTRGRRPQARGWWTVALSLALAATLAGCGGGHGTEPEAPPPETTEPPPAATPPLRVEAIVFDSTMTPLEGVQVAAVGAAASATTIADGSAGFEVTSRAPVVVRLSKPGYTDNFRRVAFAGDSYSTRVTAMLRPRAEAQPLDAAAGGALAGRHGATIVLPAGALVDAATGAAASGTVDIAMTPVDVSGDELRAFPGSFSGIDEANRRQLIATYGTTEFALSQGGRRLQLAPGRTATIELPLYTPFHAPGVPVALGDTIPLWSLDESSGGWKQEGTGTVVASAASPTGLAMRATVSHFSWWNCDMPIDHGYLDLDIETPDVPPEDRVPDDRPPDQLDNIDTDPNHYRVGPARLVHIDARTADDSLLRQAGIDLEAAFDDRSYQAAPRKNALRVQIAGSVYVVARGLVIPAGRTVSMTVCSQVKRGGLAFVLVDACGTTSVTVAKDARASRTIKLTPGPMQDVPYIVAQPAHRTVDVGQAATFSVEAVSRIAGTARNLIFQWSRNGVPIAGATGASYVTAATTEADSASQYVVVVSNAAGTTISVPARLTVNVPLPPPPPPNAGDRWVDAVAGNDANAGSLAAPLRSVSEALRQVPRGGTVWLLDGTWTPAVEPAIDRSRYGLNCNTSSLPISVGTTIRAVNPGRATLLYDSGGGVCVGDTQLIGLRLEGAAYAGRTQNAAVLGFAPGSTLLSGVTLVNGLVQAFAGARITIEPGGLADYGDPGSFNSGILQTGGAGSEIVVNGGAFGHVPNANGASGNCSGASMSAGNGARLVLNRVDIRSGGPRDANGIAGNAITACGGGRVELRNSTVAGFKRVSGDPSPNLGFAIYLAENSSALLDEATVLSGNGVGIGASAGSTVEILGGSIVEGSLGNGVRLNGDGATLRMEGGSIVRNSGSSGIEASGSGASTLRLDLAGANLTGNAETGLKASANVDCRIRGTLFSGNREGFNGGQTRTCDLGTAASPGDNVFANTATNVRIDRSNISVFAVGNTWAAGQQGADTQGRYAVPAGQTVLEVTGPVSAGANYVLSTGTKLRLAE